MVTIDSGVTNAFHQSPISTLDESTEATRHVNWLKIYISWIRVVHGVGAVELYPRVALLTAGLSREQRVGALGGYL